MLEQEMKAFLRRVIPGVLFLVTMCCSGSIGHAQITGLADAEKTLTDSGLEEIRPGVWALKAADGNNFAARKFRLLRGKKNIREALLFVGGKLEAPKTLNFLIQIAEFGNEMLHSPSPLHNNTMIVV